MTYTTRPSPILRAVGASTFLLFAAAGCGDEGAQVEASAQATGGPAETETLDLSWLGHDEGNEATAAFGVIEFADFGCIHCYDFHQDSYAALHAEFIASGDLLWKYVPVTLAGFPNSELAAISAVCAADLGGFTEMRDHLYETQPEWIVSDRGMALFVEYAESVGLNTDQFQACLLEPRAMARLEANNAMARQAGVRGTPTFLIAGSPVQGAPPLENFQGALREMIAEARALESGGGAAPPPAASP